jgi:hypothetical protein
MPGVDKLYTILFTELPIFMADYFEQGMPGVIGNR